MNETDLLIYILDSPEISFSELMTKLREEESLSHEQAMEHLGNKFATLKTSLVDQGLVTSAYRRGAYRFTATEKGIDKIAKEFG